MKESPGLHLNLAGKSIAIQKKLLQAYEERTNEQSYGAQYIWKIDHYQVEKMKISFRKCLSFYLGTIRRSTNK
jgi:hypothetical protein